VGRVRHSIQYFRLFAVNSYVIVGIMHLRKFISQVHKDDGYERESKRDDVTEARD
jgi:hypothetical protein